MRDRAVNIPADKIGRLIAAAGGLIAALGVLIVRAQAIIWLRGGEWMPLDLNPLWHFFGGSDQVTSWEDAQEIIDEVLDFPLSIVVFCFGLLILGFGTLLVERVESRKLQSN